MLRIRDQNTCFDKRMCYGCPNTLKNRPEVSLNGSDKNHITV